MVPFLPSSLVADTIVMKDGRQIEAEQIWREGEMVRYKKFGTLVGVPKEQVARVVRDSASASAGVVDFGFDFWKLGMPISEVMTVAERNDVPLHREGLISVNKQFNPKMCRPYMESHSRFEYRQTLLGYPARVTLVFTPKSRRLSSIQVHLFPNPSAPELSSNNTVMAVMSEKYGPPRKLPRNIMQKNACQWRISKENSVNLVSGSNWTELIYQNNSWKTALEKEAGHQKASRQEANHRKDAGKF